MRLLYCDLLTTIVQDVVKYILTWHLLLKCHTSSICGNYTTRCTIPLTNVAIAVILHELLLQVAT